MKFDIFPRPIDSASVFETNTRLVPSWRGTDSVYLLLLLSPAVTSDGQNGVKRKF